MTKWFKPPYRIPSTTGSYELQYLLACIHGVWLLPDANEVLFEIAHACDVSGDMCSAGGHTWEVVTP